MFVFEMKIKKKDENEENLSIAEENIIKYCVKEQ